MSPGRETGGWRRQIGEGESPDLSPFPTTEVAEGSRSGRVGSRSYEAEDEVSEKMAANQPRETPGESTIEVSGFMAWYWATKINLNLWRQPVTGVAPAGRRSVNVVPLPGSLAMSIVPE